jgi:hypothetical protein
MLKMSGPAILPLVRQLLAHCNPAHPLFDPGVVIPFELVQHPRALGGQLGVLDLLDALISDLCKSSLERLGLGGGDGLNDTEQAFGVGTADKLLATGRLNAKGGGNLPPPFGKFLVTSAHIFDISFRLDGIGKHGDDVANDKPPFSIFENLSNFLALEKCYSAFLQLRVVHKNHISMN